MNFVFKKKINRNLSSIGKTCKIKYQDIYYYDVIKEIELHESKKITIKFFKIIDQFNLYDLSLNRETIRCEIQNNDILENKDLIKTLRFIMTVVKIKRNKSKKKNPKKITKKVIDVISSFFFILFIIDLSIKPKTIKFIEAKSVKKTLTLLNYFENENAKKSRSFYMKLKDNFLKLIKKMTKRCFFLNNKVFTKK